MLVKTMRFSNRPLRNLGGWFNVMVLVFLASACERPVSKDSQIRVQLPSLSASLQKSDLNQFGAPGNLMRVYIQVTGGEVPPQMMLWEKRPNNSVPSDGFYLSVAQAPGRLVQVIAVYFDSTIPKMNLYYGDTLVDITSEAPPPVVVNVYKSVSDNVTGRISGRYAIEIGPSWARTATYPSGPIGIMFRPPDDKPPIMVAKSYMYSGWFSAFAMSDINLEYHLGMGWPNHIMFGQPVSTTSSRLYSYKPFPSPADYDASVVRVAVPITAKLSNITVAADWNEARQSIVGWFGDGSTSANSLLLGKTVLTSALSDYSSSVFLPGGGSNLSFRLETLVSSMPTATALNDTASHWGYISYVGGDLSATGAPFTDYLPIHQSIANDGNDKAAPFLGPLRTIDATEDIFTSVVPDGESTIDVQYQLLPSASSNVDQMIVYVMSTSYNLNDSNGENSFPCGNPPGSDVKIDVGLTAAQESSPPISSFSTGLTPAEFNASDRVVGLCFKKSGVFVGPGYWSRIKNPSW